MIVLQKETVLLNVSAESCEDAIQKAADVLLKQGYIGQSYVEAVLEREREYPTGIPAEELAIAIPHAFSGDVMKTGIGIVRLNEPVLFRNMADPDEQLPVKIVFLLANASGADSHLDDLQELMDSFCRVGLLTDLKQAQTPEEVVAIFGRRETYPEG